MRLDAGRDLSSLGLLLAVAASLSACGGGDAAPAPAPAPTFGVNGAVSGMNSGTLVLQVAGRADVSATANGNVTLATGLANGAAYAISVKTQPASHTCEVANGSGNIAGANVTNVQVTCVAAVAVNVASPADNALLPVDVAQNISVSFAGTTADKLTWTILPAGIAANATLTAVSSTGTSAVMSFTATVPDDYTVRVSSQDDTSRTAEIDLQVHQVYTAAIGKSQDRTYLQADGHIRSEMPGAPADLATSIASGFRFSVAARTDGTVVSWGPLITAPVPSGLVNVKAVAAGDYFAMAQHQDNTLTVWGKLNSDAMMPAGLEGVAVSAFDTALSVMAAIKPDGTLLLWRGETAQLVPLPADWQGKVFTKVCATSWHIVALDNAGVLYVWNPTNTSDPAMNSPPTTTAPVAAVFCGWAHAALLQDDGRVMTWGDELDFDGAFDSAAVSGFPRIKGVAFYSFGAPQFLTEGGAIIDTAGMVVRDVDTL
jgi:hypothetical protein